MIQAFETKGSELSSSWDRKVLDNILNMVDCGLSLVFDKIDPDEYIAIRQAADNALTIHPIQVQLDVL